MILGATNRPDSLDPALRRAGRFDAEITMGVPDQAGRERYVYFLSTSLLIQRNDRILRVLMAKLRLTGDFDYTFLAKSTPGYVGADLSALTGAAGVIAVKRIFETLGVEMGAAQGILGVTSGEAVGRVTELLEGEMENESEGELLGTVGEDGMVLDDETGSSLPPPPMTTVGSPESPVVANVLPPSTTTTVQLFTDLPPSLAVLPIASFLQNHPDALTPSQLSTLSLTNSDFTSALAIVQPSSQREGFTTVPNITWSDLGALKSIREEMRMSIVRPIRSPEIFQQLGILNPCGVLLWGPPGCGKTLLAKAVANESGANFISVKGPELLNKVSPKSS